MVPARAAHHDQPGYRHSHHDPHAHAHGPAAPHPPQPLAWSILRLTLLARLSTALAASAALWGMVWLAMR